MNKKWYENWFNNLYPKLYPHRNLEEAKKQVNSLINFLDLEQTSRCLDIACGTGRHVRYLKNEFDKTIGVDLSKDLIAIGKQKGNFDNADSFITDMREPGFEEGTFNLVCNFFTGFGYFETDKEHQDLANTWLSLVSKDGVLFLDYLNKDYVINNLVPESNKKIEEYKVSEKRQINSHNGNTRVEKLIEIESPEGKETFNESVRMYSKQEMRNFFTLAKEIKFYGDYDWSEFNVKSSRMLIVIKK